MSNRYNMTWAVIAFILVEMMIVGFAAVHEDDESAPEPIQIRTIACAYHNPDNNLSPEPEKSVVEDVESLQEDYNMDIEYLVRCVEAEAGGETELGKRLVCDVVLNRFDSGAYESLIEVINEPRQFAVVSDGRIHTVEPTEATYKIVEEELQKRTNEEVMYFRTEHYHKFGEPLFKEKGHYFSR